MKETEAEIETVNVQSKLFASFREQLIGQAVRYHDQGKFELERIVREALQSN